MFHPLHTGCVSSICFIDFVMSVKTNNTGISEDNQFKLDLNDNYTYDFNVDWGDGNTEHLTINTDITHTYSVEGTYDITINGLFPAINFAVNSDNQKVIELKSWGTQKWKSFFYGFYGCKNCVFSSTDQPHTTSVTSMKNAFFNCYNFNQAVNNFNTSNVTTMEGMFSSCSAFNQDVSNFNTSNVTTMNRMFYQCTSFNQDISGWDISELTDAQYMLGSASAFSTANYDKLLIAWNGKSHKSDVTFDCAAKYTAGGDAETARTNLINDGWTIGDGGPA